ncbi:MAG: hypothetical protein IJT32_03335 [Lachnospiraceae bacterium]|nr:hypothetical protein [Lachnospiraceae bacterium]
MSGSVIQNRLDLLIRLQDTTTGLSVGERGIKFRFNGREIRPTPRGDGNYILINHGRDNGLMQIEVYGYEPFEAAIDYEQLDERLPVLDAFLIPSEEMRLGHDLVTLSGHLKGLKSIEAIHLARPLSGLREFDPKRCVMTVYMPNRRMNMTHTYYGLVNAAAGTFEEFMVLEEMNDKKVRIKAPLQEEFAPNAPICRLIFGKVFADGSYLVRVRKTGKNLKHMVRFVTEEGTEYQTIDFGEFAEKEEE